MRAAAHEMDDLPRARSAIYHTFRCMTEAWNLRLYRLDIAGICTLIYGSFMAGIYNGFYCTAVWQCAGFLPLPLQALLCPRGCTHA